MLSNRKDLQRAAELFHEARRIRQDYRQAVKDAEASYGGHGPLISGVVRDHFPQCTKDHLRSLCRNINMLNDAGFAARPKRVHEKTMLKLYREINHD